MNKNLPYYYYLFQHSCDKYEQDTTHHQHNIIIIETETTPTDNAITEHQVNSCIHMSGRQASRGLVSDAPMHVPALTIDMPALMPAFARVDTESEKDGIILDDLIS